ncbi:hypothetical protein GCM10027169_01730 [Gordonia jinhuaensis]|uniref:Uncharacterized protein n=1 Tax=Gordonia jinhuaensis TaxID=1517702 RepID=A0A916T1J2_9ACTN|nr:hypothetical protein GCM10011489_15260 [Gordonia jinhuaensis]
MFFSRTGSHTPGATCDGNPEEPATGEAGDDRVAEVTIFSDDDVAVAVSEPDEQELTARATATTDTIVDRTGKPASLRKRADLVELRSSDSVAVSPELCRTPHRCDEAIHAV